MSDKEKGKRAPDPQVFEIEWQGVKVEIKRDSKEFRNLQNLAEAQIENQFLEERSAKLDTVKAFISETFTSDDFMALNGFGFYVHFNAQRFTDNGCVKSTALKVYARIPKAKADSIVITDVESLTVVPDTGDEPEGEVGTEG